MSERRRLLIAVSGTEDPGLVAELAGLVGTVEPGLELLLLHVVDSGPRGLLPLGPEPRRGAWPKPQTAALEARVRGAEEDGAAALLAMWSERLSAGLPGATITSEVRHGAPEREIVAAAAALGPAAVVLCPRPRTGPTEPGPRSLGHVARFVVDHAPVPVLLVRRSAGPRGAALEP